MISIIFHFELVHLNDLFCDEVDDIVKAVDVKGVLNWGNFARDLLVPSGVV